MPKVYNKSRNMMIQKYQNKTLTGKPTHMPWMKQKKTFSSQKTNFLNIQNSCKLLTYNRKMQKTSDNSEKN